MADRQTHGAGIVLPERGDGLHWLRCVDCGEEWAEKDSGALARGSRYCDPTVAREDSRIHTATCEEKSPGAV